MDLDYALSEKEPHVPTDIDAPEIRKNKALVITLMKRLTSKIFDSSKGVRAHIMEIRDLAIQFKTLKIDISEPFLVHFIINSFLAEYGPFKISYNAHKEGWSMTELLTICVQEEERSKHDKPEVAHLATRAKGKGKKDHGKRKDGHIKKDCPKYQKWLEKRVLSQPKESDGK
ncbi:hypothetical protein CRG98_010582 [Punica granatum]|uniref:Uncharacterized protein n=1 Tax=Punica granatum TaxID=22663 RepID=A0A2I0KKF5_PUNGR|nr:hypothetical protein CRG98_010582 [Punica granatum]